MTEKLPSTWHWREFPLLREAARRLDSGETHLDVATLARDLNIDREQTRIGLQALKDDGYLDGPEVAEWGLVEISSISPRARRAVGLWPTPDTGTERLISAVDVLIAQAPTPEERTRLERLRDGLRGVGQQVLVSVAAAMITGALPGQGA